MVIIFGEGPKTVIFNALNLVLVCRDNMLNDELLYVCVCACVCVYVKVRLAHLDRVVRLVKRDGEVKEAAAE